MTDKGIETRPEYQPVRMVVEPTPGEGKSAGGGRVVSPISGPPHSPTIPPPPNSVGDSVGKQ